MSKRTKLTKILRRKKAMRQRRQRRVRLKLKEKRRLRLSVFRSLKHIYAQIIDDQAGQTLVSFSDLNLSAEEKKNKNKTAIAFLVGQHLAAKAQEKEITTVVFDRGCYRYHGRVKALAEGARSGGLRF